MALLSHLASLVQANGPQNGIDDAVRIAIGAGTTILKVAASIIGDTPWNSNRGTAMGHTGTKVGDFAGLVLARQSSLVVLSSMGIISADVAIVCLG